MFNKKIKIDSKDRWILDKYSCWISSTGYAVINIGDKKIKLHRFIMSADKGKIVDHINGDKLDNRRKNLRISNYSQNNYNVKVARKDNKTGIKGVYKRGKRFVAIIKVNNKRVWLGTYDTPQIANAVYESYKSNFI